MAAFCHYWRCMPSDIDALSPAEFRSMTLFAVRAQRAERRAANRAARKG